MTHDSGMPNLQPICFKDEKGNEVNVISASDVPFLKPPEKHQKSLKGWDRFNLKGQGGMSEVMSV